MAQDSNPSAAEAQAQLRYLQSVYSQQYELIENEIATFTIAMGAVQRNLEILESKDKLANSTILINGDGGAYIEASIKSVNKALVYVGAGYLVEKDAEAAMEFLKGNGKKQEDAIKKLISEKEKIEKELVDISYKLSALSPEQSGIR